MNFGRVSKAIKNTGRVLPQVLWRTTEGEDLNVPDTDEFGISVKSKVHMENRKCLIA